MNVTKDLNVCENTLAFFNYHIGLSCEVLFLFTSIFITIYKVGLLPLFVLFINCDLNFNPIQLFIHFILLLALSVTPNRLLPSYNVLLLQPILLLPAPIDIFFLVKLVFYFIPTLHYKSFLTPLFYF
jgi:hypothetical protein